jgi:hypothetical protein
MNRDTAVTSAAGDRGLLLRILDECYNRPTWNGTNLRSSLKGVTAAEAGWRPPRARRTIAEIIVHCAYWKYIVRRRLSGDRRRTFPLKGSDWPAVPRPLADEQWSECVRIIDDEHRKLRAVVGEVIPGPASGSSGARGRARQAFGIAAHDAYHTGQIRLLRAMYRRARSASGRSSGTR